MLIGLAAFSTWAAGVPRTEIEVGDLVRVVEPATAHLAEGTTRLEVGLRLLVVQARPSMVALSLRIDGVRELAWVRRGSLRQAVAASRPPAVSLADLEDIGVRIQRPPGGPVIAIDASDTPIRDNDLALFSKPSFDVSKLVDLRLSGTAISDTGLRHLAGLTSLETLYLSQTAISPRATALLPAIPNLEVLSLQATNLGDASVAALAKLPRLRTLNLSRTRIGDAGIDFLRENRTLEVLALAHTRVGSSAIARLRGAKNLHTLNVDATRVSDTDVAQLLALAGLRLLYARDIGISEERIRELRRAKRSLAVMIR